MAFEFTTCDILSGIPSHNDLNLHIVNFLILYGKNYLKDKKSKNEQLHFSAFLSNLKYKTEALCVTSTDRGIQEIKMLKFTERFMNYCNCKQHICFVISVNIMD